MLEAIPYRLNLLNLNSTRFESYRGFIIELVESMHCIFIDTYLILPMIFTTMYKFFSFKQFSSVLKSFLHMTWSSHMTAFEPKPFFVFLHDA